MTDPTQLYRHGIPSLHTTASTRFHSLPLTTLNSNFRHAARLFFSVPMHVLGAAPIKAPFDHRVISSF